VLLSRVISALLLVAPSGSACVPYVPPIIGNAIVALYPPSSYHYTAAPPSGA